MWLLGDNYDKMKAVKFLPLFSALQMVPPLSKMEMRFHVAVIACVPVFLCLPFFCSRVSYPPPSCLSLPCSICLAVSLFSVSFVLNSDIPICNVFRTVYQSVTICLRGCCPLMEEND